MICTNEIASVAVKNCIKEIRKWLYYSSGILMRGECGRVNEGAWELVFTLEIFDLYSITPTLTTLLP